MPGRVIQAAVDKWRSGSEEVVVLLRQMRHVVNLGYDCSAVRVLQRFNGAPVHTLAGLAAMAAEALDGPAPPPCSVIRFGFKDDPDDMDAVVLKASQVRDADKEICEKNKIAKPQQLADAGTAASMAPAVKQVSPPKLAAPMGAPADDRLRATVKPSMPGSFRLKAAGSLCFQGPSGAAACMPRLKAPGVPEAPECQGPMLGFKRQPSPVDLAVRRASALRQAGGSICERPRMAELVQW